MKYKGLRTQILAIVASLTILLLIVVNIYTYQDRRQILYNVSIEKLLVLTKITRNFEKKQLKLYKSRSNTIQYDKNIIKMILNEDVELLEQYLSKVQDTFKSATSNLNHMHIFNLKGEYIYDADKLEIGGLHAAIDNNVLQEAMKRKKFTTGYVIFNKNNYFFSIVSPIRYNKKIIAYIEFGISADNRFKIASKAGRYKYALYLHNTDTYSDKRELGNLVTSNSSIFENLQIDQEFIYEYANKNKIVSFQDKEYLFHQYDIESSFQENFAQVIMASDVTKYVKNNRSQTFLMIAISLFILFITYASIYIIVTKLINKLIEDEKELSRKHIQMQVIIDHNDNLITLFNEDTLVLANKPFVSFFSFSSLDDFKTHHKSVDELFIQTDDTFMPEEKGNNQKWIAEIKSLGDTEKVIALKHYKYGLNYFNVQVTSVPNQVNSFVVVFSNVTTIFKQSQKDQYMARHDALTAIFNRQSFNESITHDLLQQLSHSHNSSLLMFDLDLFKRVNDTYGHQVGDEVLISFSQIITKSIRANDIFARWGGEEFVLLLIGTPEDTATTIANTLREKIQTSDFDKAGTITCSIGLSTYCTGDTVESWFTRVDEALYKAKENGRNRVEIL